MKTITMGIFAAIVLSFLVIVAAIDVATTVHAQTVTSSPTLTPTVTGTSTNNSTTVPQGAPNTGFQP
ncbi:MAG TPA: hypothetical protein VG965_02750 [Patescibacteria group bacterium]|nr:hypothetical protein [Patescibacteria group bacterium]